MSKSRVPVERLVGVGASARLLSVSRQTVHHYLKAGVFQGAFQLPTGVWRIPLGEIEAVLGRPVVDAPKEGA